MIIFISLIIPVASTTFLAHNFDKSTYHYVKDNSFGANSNQILPSMENDQAIPELTDHQKELLKIPLNAVRVSLFYFAVIGIFLLIRLFMGQLSIWFRVVVVSTVFCILQGSRVIIILTCLHKANVLNQAELSQCEMSLATKVGENTFISSRETSKRFANRCCIWIMFIFLV